MKSKLSIKTNSIKNIFKRENTFSNKCRICDMEFTDPERTKRHMIKAHSKPKREKHP
ncbi:MAG: hypothetical protein ACE5DT_00585 [Nitrosopumilus sp.]